ncbi:T9SS type A sorting domain-containing protein [Wenyingzhuangia aestuarii]|uniref:T9SS type A sorting domain-containing protein n=1 Tax=Wenyingzhuangia aestuarii TaxID=1647582 RepID=UPI00143C6A23|nr:T9SS type A sorting domain-containing protein [Wenyingzhuangia aestuarii]NJB81861.1 hypothetical protein [Wenyingzhuangia aestuarii]
MIKRILLAATLVTNICAAQIFDFNTDGDFEGFTGTVNCTAVVANGYLSITPTGDGTSIAKVTNPTLGVDANTKKYIHFFYKNLSTTSGAGDNSIDDGNDQLRFEASNDSGVEGQTFGGNNNAINLNSSDFEIKTVNLTTSNWWQGTIGAFHLYPRRSNSGSDLDEIQITRIEFSDSATPTPLPGPAFAEDFESGTPSGLAAQNNANDANLLVEVVAIPGGTTGNSTSNVLKVTESGTTENYHYPILSLGTALNPSNGNYISLLFLPGETGAGTFTLRLRAGSTVVANIDYNYETTDTTTWVAAEWDLSSYISTNNINRIDFWYDNGGRSKASPLVRYIDEIKQTVAPTLLTLNSSSPSFKNVGVYPNPTTGIINISDISNIQGNIYIVNVLGQIVKTVKAANTITISDLPQGIYFLQTGNQLIKKIIKK